MTRESEKAKGTAPIGTGGALRRDQTELIGRQGFSFSGYERDPLYASLGGKKFLDISGVSGIDSITDGRAAVFADFDDDGDLDVFLTTIQGPGHLLFRNEVGQDSGWLRIALEGTRSGRDAWGAVVRVRTSAGTLTKIKSGGSGFLAQHDPRLLFGLGGDAAASSIEVTWPSGTVERFEGVRARTSLRIREGEGRFSKVEEKPSRLREPLSPRERLATGLAIRAGGPLPSLPAFGLDGKKTSLEARLRPGRRTLVNFWATWCAACRHEIPRLVKLAPALLEAGVDVLGISVDTTGSGPVGKYARERKIGYPIVVAAPGAVQSIWKGEQVAVPLTILVGADGKVEEILGGASAGTMRAIERLAKR